MGGKAKIECQPNCKRQGTSMTLIRSAAEKRRRRQIIEEILSESLENNETGNAQEPNIDAVSVNTVEHIDIDSAPVNLTPDQKVSVETQTDIKNRTVAVQVNNRPKYRSVAVQCKILSTGVDKSCSPLRQKSISNLLDAQKSLSLSSFTHSNSSQEIYEPSENTGSSTMDSGSCQSPVKKAEILKVTNYLINDNLKAYTGVPQEWNVIVCVMCTLMP
ncbi:unnamed protein product [Danaus chrysippus]|uniref:(African queen) hypothetical protein n=1 Tax=Danaus chrysippus TaxID=151541 RepID=A0A8J2QJD0_9NEOP|nr:unnamed protein product [Danaus chrysippus]